MRKIALILALLVIPIVLAQTPSELIGPFISDNPGFLIAILVGAITYVGLHRLGWRWHDYAGPLAIIVGFVTFLSLTFVSPIQIGFQGIYAPFNAAVLGQFGFSALPIIALGVILILLAILVSRFSGAVTGRGGRREERSWPMMMFIIGVIMIIAISIIRPIINIPTVTEPVFAIGALLVLIGILVGAFGAFSNMTGGTSGRSLGEGDLANAIRWLGRRGRGAYDHVNNWRKNRWQNKFNELLSGVIPQMEPLLVNIRRIARQMRDNILPGITRGRDGSEVQQALARQWQGKDDLYTKYEQLLQNKFRFIFEDTVNLVNQSEQLRQEINRLMQYLANQNSNLDDIEARAQAAGDTQTRDRIRQIKKMMKGLERAGGFRILGGRRVRGQYWRQGFDWIRDNLPNFQERMERFRTLFRNTLQIHLDQRDQHLIELAPEATREERTRRMNQSLSDEIDNLTQLIDDMLHIRDSLKPIVELLNNLSQVLGYFNNTFQNIQNLLGAVAAAPPARAAPAGRGGGAARATINALKKLKNAAKNFTRKFNKQDINESDIKDMVAGHMSIYSFLIGKLNHDFDKYEEVVRHGPRDSKIGKVIEAYRKITSDEWTQAINASGIQAGSPEAQRLWQLHAEIEQATQTFVQHYRNVMSKQIRKDMKAIFNIITNNSQNNAEREDIRRLRDFIAAELNIPLPSINFPDIIYEKDKKHLLEKWLETASRRTRQARYYRSTMSTIQSLGHIYQSAITIREHAHEITRILK